MTEKAKRQRIKKVREAMKKTGKIIFNEDDDVMEILQNIAVEEQVEARMNYIDRQPHHGY